jgi:type VI secretion system protein VasJ
MAGLPHRLMKSLRHDTLSAIPAPDAEGKTRIEPPRADQRAMLKRLYLQQSWLEILEQADSTFSRGANHLWLDLQWYIHQALVKSGQDVLADIITADLKGLLRRLTGLETLAFNDGTPFADEVTLNWINQSVLDDMSGWRDEPVSAVRRITTFWPLSRKRWRKRTVTVWMPLFTGCRHVRAPTP